MIRSIWLRPGELRHDHPPQRPLGWRPAGVQCISFRDPGGRAQRLSWHAGLRVKGGPGPLALMHVLADSSAGLQILWDVVQHAEPDQELTIVDDADLSFLHGPLYASLVEVTGGDDPGPDCHRVELRRLAASEDDDLLPGWTFALPTGGGDSTALTMAVGRILEMRGDDFEVLLCGEPGPGFPYRDRVRILPDPKPGEINLPAKKNALADAARYRRLAILHDRVLLPPDFLTRMAAFGRDGGFVGLPILYFLDQDGLRGRRYSDLNTVQRFAAFELTGAASAGQPGRIITRELAPEVGRFSVYAYVPLHGADRFGFLTGSFYTCSTRLWRRLRQDETLPWEYFEDVEFGHRCRALGIPHRLLGTTMALSITGRSSVIDSTGTWYAEGGWRRTAFQRIPFAGLRPARPRPLLARDFGAHRRAVRTFMHTWCKRTARLRAEEMAVRLCGEARQTAIADLLDMLDPLRIDGAAVLERLLRDFERQILGETLEVNGRHELVKRVLLFGSDLGGEIMENWAVKAQCRLTDDGLMPLLGDQQDRVPRPLDWRIRAGLALFVLVAYWRARRELCLPGGALTTWRALLRCWPVRQDSGALNRDWHSWKEATASCRATVPETTMTMTGCSISASPARVGSFRQAPPRARRRWYRCWTATATWCGARMARWSRTSSSAATSASPATPSGPFSPGGRPARGAS